MSDAPQIVAVNFADHIPILDPGPYLSGEPGVLEAISRELYRASTEVGFYFLKNHVSRRHSSTACSKGRGVSRTFSNPCSKSRS
jgi:isopenicillin N synthase-like dioxygenase